MSKYYTPSGKFEPISILYFVLIAVIVAPILSHLLTPKIESILKLIYYDALPYFLPFTAQEFKSSRRF